MLRQYFNCNERLEIFLTNFCNILCYVGPFYNSIVDIPRRMIFPKFCHGLFKIIAVRIHIFRVAQATGFDILIRNYL